MYYQNPYQNPYNPYGAMYGQGVQQMPKAKNTQPLTPEMISQLRTNNSTLTIEVPKEDLWRAACTHKETDGRSALSEVEVLSNGERKVRCSICGEEFILTNVTEKDVEDAVNTIINYLQTSKTLYLDAPEKLITQYYQMIPLLKKLPQLYTRAVQNFDMYDNALNQPNYYGGAATNGFQMMGAMLNNPYAGYAGYYQPQPAGNPQGYYQPGYMPQQPQPQYPQGYYQPGYMPQQQQGYVPNPVGSNNPFAYGQVPANTAAPAPAPAVPTPPPAENKNGEIVQTKSYQV